MSAVEMQKSTVLSEDNPWNNSLNLDYGDEFGSAVFPRFPYLSDEQAQANLESVTKITAVTIVAFPDAISPSRDLVEIGA